MAVITIWHNPRCSKSREALALLEAHGKQHSVRRYLDDVPTVEEIGSTRDTLCCLAIEMIRKGESLFRELELSKDDDDEALIAAMASHPKLIERPIVFVGSRAVIGRPPQRVLDIL
ncbi:MAG: arsenate reductase (glutaredoxin) [Roseovarius sp.]|nr:arsenate reductase (glutaredoxin) [Roseovarius sp.]